MDSHGALLVRFYLDKNVLKYIFMDIILMRCYFEDEGVIHMKRKLTEHLMKWKAQREHRLPMLIYGARQVGKTFTVLEFGKEHYTNVLYVNFEQDMGLTPYFEGDISPGRIISVLEQYYQTKVTPDGTLLFFDEVQACERALTSLKYFAENAPEYSLVAAGSLLGVAVNRNRFSFPVGKVQMATLHPLDFEEFLWAKGKTLLADEIRRCCQTNEPIHDQLHREALAYYREYLVIGGMPAAVKASITPQSVMTEQEVRRSILNAYTADMTKYASPSESVKIQSAFESIPAQLAKENTKFQYKLIRSGGRASLYGDSIDWLIASGVVLKCVKCEQGLMPPVAYQDLSSFKLYMSDVGLLSARAGITLQSLGSADIHQFSGALTENYVAGALAARGFELNYWESKSSAEVDFLIVMDGSVVPVEVKAAENTRSRSLAVFMDRYKPQLALRFSARNFGFGNGIKSVPLYAVFAI